MLKRYSLIDKSMNDIDEFNLSPFPNIDAPWSPMPLATKQEMRNHKERNAGYKKDSTF